MLNVNGLSLKLPIRDSLSVDHSAERIDEDVVVVPVAESPFEFFEVTVEMLSGHLVERTDDGTLEQRPDAFDGVGVNVADGPFLDGVVDRLVTSVVVCDAQVGGQFVGVDRPSLASDRLIRQRRAG